MHSFHRSRGRIFFEVLCAVGMSASLVGAWMQTGASALLAAASVGGLYALVHAFDLARRAPAVAVEPERSEPVEKKDEAPACEPATAPVVAADAPPPVTDVDEAQVVEPRRAKAPRKGGARRAKAPAKAKVSDPAPAEEPAAADAPAVEEPKIVAIVPEDDVPHPPVAPLFEAEPFVRQQRAVFGRKAG